MTGWAMRACWGTVSTLTIEFLDKDFAKDWQATQRSRDIGSMPSRAKDYVARIWIRRLPGSLSSALCASSSQQHRWQRLSTRRFWLVRLPLVRP